jgi:acyl-CoA synthetase (AMP-forming)/AMP-acid ligase II
MATSNDISLQATISNTLEAIEWPSFKQETLLHGRGDFGVDKTSLRTGESPNLQRYSVMRDDEEPEIERFPGYRFQNRLFEPLLATLDTAKKHGIGLARHREQGFNHVFSGRVRAVLGGNAVDLGTDDIIKCSGYRISPFEVESAPQSHKIVLECAATSAPDPIRGQVVETTMVLARGNLPSDALVRELQEHDKSVTAPYRHPQIIERVDELPKTIAGKIRRIEISARDERRGGSRSGDEG